MGLSFTQASYCATALMLVAGVTLVGVGLSGNRWFETSTTSQVQFMGLSKTCQGIANCTDNSFDDLDVGGACEVKGDDVKFRINLVRFTSYGGMGFSGLCALLTLVGAFKARGLVYAGFVASMLGFICLLVSVLLYFHTMNQWMFCGGYCDWHRKSVDDEDAACVAYFGFSYALCCCGAFLCIVATFFVGGTAVVDATRRKVANAEGAASPTDRQDTRATPHNEPFDNLDKASPTQPPTTHTTGATYQTAHPAPDGYEWDDESGMFYSAEHQLYFDPNSGHFYNAETGEWLDPATETWYTC